jgi:putative addiction module component (TIGR02574 family)
MLPVLPLDQMTVEEKLQLMDILWDDLSQNAGDIPPPAWHGELLAARQREIDEGRATFLSLDEFRQDIEKETL